MNIDRIGYEITDDYASIFEYLNKTRKLLYALKVKKGQGYAPTFTCGISRNDDMVVMNDRFYIEHIKNEKQVFIKFCKKEKFKFVCPERSKRNED